MQIIHDFIILELDRLFDVREEGGLITLNEAYVQHGERDRNIYKRISGIVTSLPRGYSDLKIDPVDPGVPNYKIYVGHDVIQERVNEGYKWDRENYYYPGSTESYEFRSMQDVDPHVDVRIGDTVYVHPNQLEEENALWKKDGKYYFRVRVDEILCAVRDGQIIAQGQHVLVKPNMEKESDLIQGGLQIKPQAEAKPLQGFIFSCRPEFCIPGVLVFFIEDSEWLITIEGIPVYVMKEEQIMCWLETAKATNLEASDAN